MRARLLAIVALAALAEAATGADAAPAHFCQAAAADLKADPALAEAAYAVFGHPGFADGDLCIAPLQRLHYADADVLISGDQAPGEACDGCTIKLSATVLQRAAGRLRQVWTFPAFAESASKGGPGKITAVTLGADDGIAIETAWATQGYSGRALELYAFRRGLASLTGKTPVPLAGDNSGAVTDADKAVSIDSSWAIHGDALQVDYVVDKAGAKRRDHAEWKIGPSALTLTSGSVPAEMTAATGQK